MKLLGDRSYRLDHAELCPSTRTILVDGSPQAVRPQAFDVLVYLIENRNRLVSKEELIEAVWHGLAVGDNSLSQCVADLRRVLGDSAREPRFIRTVMKGGYQFIGPFDEVIVPLGSSAVQVAVEEEDAGAATPSRLSAARKRIVWAAAGLTAIALAAIGIVLSVRPSPPGRSELAWWRLNEGSGTQVRDASGHKLTGRIDGPARWVPGRQGSELEFDGLSTMVTGHDVRMLPLGSSPRTVTAWIRHARAISDFKAIFDYGAAGLVRNEPAADPSPRFSLGLNPLGRLWFGGPPHFAGITDLADDKWHFVAGAFDGTTTRLFVDGHEDGKGQLPDRIDTGSDRGWAIGASVVGGTPFRGSIADVRVFGRAFNLQQVQALGRCTSGQGDLNLGPGTHYFLPILYDGLEVDRERGEIQNVGRDTSGVQFARSDGVCAAASLRGEDVGQDVKIRVDLLVPSDGVHNTIAGPYFRSRRALPREAIMGGESAGFLVQLDSRGMVKVRRLNPNTIIAFRAARAEFDASVFHTLEAEVSGDLVRVKLDGEPVVFDYGGAMVSSVPLKPDWERLQPRGLNQGAAGIVFLTDDRGLIGGQRARNLAVTVTRR